MGDEVRSKAAHLLCAARRIVRGSGRRKDHQAFELPQCFGGDTLVCTNDGYQRISDIQVGQEVLCRSETTGDQAYRRVVNRFVYHGKVACQLTINVDGLWDTVSVTPEHPVWVNGEGWVEAGNLRRGQILEICNPDAVDHELPIEALLATRLSGQRWTAKVERVERHEDHPRTVFSLEVEDFHTYFVGSYGLWVHNKQT